PSPRRNDRRKNAHASKFAFVHEGVYGIYPPTKRYPNPKTISARKISIRTTGIASNNATDIRVASDQRPGKRSKRQRATTGVPAKLAVRRRNAWLSENSMPAAVRAIPKSATTKGQTSPRIFSARSICNPPRRAQPYDPGRKVDGSDRAAAYSSS